LKCFPAQDNLESPIVPTFIANVFVSHAVTKAAGAELDVYMKIDKKSHRDTISSETVYQQGGTLPVISITGLTTTSLAANKSQDALKNVKKTYFKTAWAADPSLLTSKQMSDMCNFLRPGPEEAALCRLFDEMGYYIAERALAKVPEGFVNKMKPHNQKLYQSVKRLQNDVRTNRLPFDVSSWSKTTEEQRDAVWEQVRNSGDEGRFVALVGDNMHRILLEEVDPLSVTMQDDALGKYYANNTRMARQYQQAAVYVNLLGHKNPHLKILEIGSGTGGATLPILKALGGGKDGSLARFTSYDVTDISTGFFEKVQEKVSDWKDLVNYRKLDIEVDPAEQGFEVGSHDLIIAANVLHATKSMERTMNHVRRLLKPGGKLILTELMKKNGGIANLFGIFPGWWIGEEEERQEGALLTEENWDVILRKTGFGGVEISIWDTPDQMTHQGSNIITTAVEQAVTSNGILNGTHDADTLIITDNSEDPVLADLKNKLLSDVTISSLLSANPKGKKCVVLTEVQSPLLVNPTEEQFEAVKKLMIDSAGVLWVTRGAAVEGAKPDLNMINGLMRTLRLELGGNTLITLDLSHDSNKVEQSAWLSGTDTDLISRVFQTNFGTGAHLSNTELEIEYAERDGIIMVGRIVVDSATTLDVASRIHNAEPILDTVGQPGRPLKLEIETPGLLDSLYWDDDRRMAGDPQGDEVDIEVKATAVNFRDVMMAMGQIETHALGCECSGVVTKIGPEVQGFKVGDRVITHADGSFSNFVRSKQSAGGIVHMPDSMTFETATTLPIVYCTALHAIKVAGLQKGESVLIHAASGGLGQALIMLCQYFEADIYATVGTIEKKQFLMDHFKIPEDRIFSSRDPSFAKGIMRRTEGRGVDVVMNSLSSDLLRVTWQCIASFGRFIELGKRDFAVNGRLEMAPFARNVSYIAVDLVTFLEDRPAHGKRIWNEVMELVRGGHVHAPQPISIYAMADVEKALRIMQSGKHMGKLVLVPTEDDKAKVSRSSE
jgi:NADPH:quinone reductase-like Zn-dependent oxidoreductase/SAM-dependent methyltransferase